MNEPDYEQQANDLAEQRRPNTEQQEHRYETWMAGEQR